MSDSNDQTLQSYEEHIQEYIDGTPQHVGSFVQEWIDASLSYIPKGGSVLELGSAFGRDADYIEKAGFAILRTDATKGFVDLLQKEGHTAQVLNAITDDLGGPYDMVFADAVLLHFTIEDFQKVIEKVHKTLKPGGIFAFCVKLGTGSQWSSDKLGSPRFFQYWTPETLKPAIETQFELLRLSSDSAGKWLHVIAKKK